MSLIQFKDYPSEETPISAETLNNNFNELSGNINDILNLVYPIGRGFIDFTDTDYTNYLGFVWERELCGLTPIGAGTHTDKNNKMMTFILGEKTGEYEHKQTIEELVSHDHGSENEQFSTALLPKNRISTTGDGSGSKQNRTKMTGGGKPFNILQPSEVVSFWKRVS